MRQIKFRGKRLDNGEWAYGYYVIHHFAETQTMPDGTIKVTGITESPKIFDDTIRSDKEGFWKIVSADSVGQFTGLTDCNRNEIYEGDIVRIRITPTLETKEANDNNADLMGIKMPDWINGGDIIARVSYFDCAFHFIHLQSYLPQSGKNVQEPMLNYLFHERYPDYHQSYDHTIEVIGNIHDNPNIDYQYFKERNK